MLARQLAELLLLPPLGNLWLAGLGAVLGRFEDGRTLGTVLAATSLVALLLWTAPRTAHLLSAAFDRHPPLPAESAAALPAADCVVILGARLRRGARELGLGAAPSAGGLERLSYGARLARRASCPVLLTGVGSDVAAETLEQSFGITPRFVENRSRTTHESAVLSSRRLETEGIRRVYLVTHFWHMPRALAAFESTGLEPIAAPMGFFEPSRAEHGLLGLLPRSWALEQNRELLHEGIGRIWYRWRHRHGVSIS